MKRGRIPGRTPATLAAVTLLAAATVVAGEAGVSAAQDVVTTQSYTIANTSAPGFSAVAQPDTAGSTADYLISFTNPTALTAGVSTVTLTDPSGATVFPAAAGDYLVYGNTPTGSQAVSRAELGAGNHSVTLVLGSSVAAGQPLSIYVMGATNPAQAGTYSLDVSTSGDTALTSTASYQITAATSTPALNPTASPLVPGNAATYVIGTFKAASALAAGDLISLSSSAGTGTTDDVTFPTTASDYTINDLTTGTSVVPTNVSVSGAASGLTGQTVLLTVPGTVAAGDVLSVTVTGAHNPTTVQSDTISAAAPSTAAATTGSLQLGTSVSGTSIALSQTGAGATGAQYIVGFTASTALPAGGTVTLTAPAGTSFSGAKVTVTDSNPTAGWSSVVATPLKLAQANGSAVDNQLTVALPSAVAAGDTVYIELNGVTNPTAGAYGGGTGDFTLSTSTDAVAVEVPSYSVTSTSSALEASVELSSMAPGTAATYTIGNLKTTAALASGSSTIELKAPAGTVFPSVASDYTIGDLTTSAAPAHPVAVAGGGTDDVVLTLGANVAAGDYVDIVASDVDNPGPSVYNMSVVGDVAAAIAPSSVVAPSPALGYWLATKTGQVYGVGAAASLGGMTTTSSTGPVVGIASTPDGQGYWVVTANGTVSAFGDAKSYGDLPADHVSVSDVVAIAPTTDGDGYWLVGRDGGMFAFGDAAFHGSIPGLHLHVSNIVGMVASPDGAGYLIVGSDGGVFSFGSAKFYGSLPGLHKHVNDIRAILPSSTGTGYVLVGSDGGAFVFGTGAHFAGSLPGRDIKVDDVVGIALTPDDGGYYMAGANGTVYTFGDAASFPAPSGLTSHLPVVAIAET